MAAGHGLVLSTAYQSSVVLRIYLPRDGLLPIYSFQFCFYGCIYIELAME